MSKKKRKTKKKRRGKLVWVPDEAIVMLDHCALPRESYGATILRAAGTLSCHNAEAAAFVAKMQAKARKR